jgi:hypothetical protein
MRQSKPTFVYAIKISSWLIQILRLPCHAKGEFEAAKPCGMEALSESSHVAIAATWQQSARNLDDSNTGFAELIQ